MLNIYLIQWVFPDKIFKEIQLNLEDSRLDVKGDGINRS